uniref:Transmembrane protein 272 n=1 Tax=Ailuropoda melanoleuca TaxID=9646 RepID=A0A7N5KIV4_AILME
MPGGLEKACYQCILKIASNGVSPAVRLQQDEAASVQGHGDR